MPDDDTVTPDTGFVMSDSFYKKAKWMTTVVLPAISTLYFTLGSIWGLPAVTQVIGTITALTLFLGVLLGISTKTYNASDAKYDGVVNVDYNEEGTKVVSLEVNGDPHDIEMMKDLKLKVNSSK